MFFLIVLAAWLAGVVVSFLYGNRLFPAIVLVIGIGLLLAPIGVWKLVGLAILAAIMWIANKAEMM
jgi:hypothetical protein